MEEDKVLIYSCLQCSDCWAVSQTRETALSYSMFMSYRRHRNDQFSTSQSLLFKVIKLRFNKYSKNHISVQPTQLQLYIWLLFAWSLYHHSSPHCWGKSLQGGRMNHDWQAVISSPHLSGDMAVMPDWRGGWDWAERTTTSALWKPATDTDSENEPEWA